jgi:rare lipoprotein A
VNAAPPPAARAATSITRHPVSTGSVQMAALPPEGAADPSAGASATSPIVSAAASSTEVGHWIAPDADLAATLRQEPVHSTHIFIQAGAFENYGNADQLRQRLTSIGTVHVTRVMVRGTEFYRVRLGPIGSVTQADQMLRELIGIGQTNARIVVD